MACKSGGNNYYRIDIPIINVVQKHVKLVAGHHMDIQEDWVLIQGPIFHSDTGYYFQCIVSYIVNGHTFKQKDLLGEDFVMKLVELFSSLSMHKFDCSSLCAAS